MSLPAVWRPSRSRCAAAASASGYVRSMRSLSLPAATQPSTSPARHSSSSALARDGPELGRVRNSDPLALRMRGRTAAPARSIARTAPSCRADAGSSGSCRTWSCPPNRTPRPRRARRSAASPPLRNPAGCKGWPHPPRARARSAPSPQWTRCRTRARPASWPSAPSARPPRPPPHVPGRCRRPSAETWSASGNAPSCPAAWPPRRP